jgi:hypothetical protein
MAKIKLPPDKLTDMSQLIGLAATSKGGRLKEALKKASVALQNKVATGGSEGASKYGARTAGEVAKAAAGGGTAEGAGQVIGETPGKMKIADAISGLLGGGGKVQKMMGSESISKALGGANPGKIAKFVGGNWWWLLPILLGAYAKTQIKDIGDTKLQAQNIAGQRADVSPDNQFYQSMMPQVEAQTQMSQAALFQQLAGGAQPPTPLARGEDIIGGRNARPQY